VQRGSSALGDRQNRATWSTPSMRMAIWMTAVCVTLFVAMVVARGSRAAAGERPARVLRHIVMYKFRDDLPRAQLQEVIDAFAALPGKIDTIVDFERGTNVSPEGKSEGLTHAFVVTFRDEAGRDAYLKHPAHLEYVKLAGARREKVVVFDYWSAE
jgi:hypothetical protein